MAVKSLAAVDWEHAETAANRIVLAYEIADLLSDFAEEQPELQPAALTIANIAIIFGMIQLGVTEREACSEFGKVFRKVRRVSNRFGKDARLRDVITELSLK